MFDTRCGESASRQINALEAINRAAATPEMGDGYYDTINHHFWEATVQTDDVTPSELCGDPTIDGTRQDIVPFGTEYGAAGLTRVNYGYQVKNNDLSGTAGSPLGINTIGGCVFDFDATDHPGLAVLYRCVNDVQVGLFASGLASTANGGLGAAGECTHFGPFIRGSASLDSFITAHLVRSAANKVKLRIVTYQAGVQTVEATSTEEATLSGTAWNSTTQQRLGPGVRITENGNSIVATCTWPNETGFGTLMISKTISTLAGNSRVGCIGLPAAGATALANRWYVYNLYYTKIVPKSVTQVAVVSRFSKQEPKQLRYFVPEGFTSYGLSTAGALSPLSGSSATPAVNHEPFIDQTTSTLRAITGAAWSSFILPTSAPASRQQIEVRGRRDATPDDNAAGDTEDICGVVLRATADRLNMILIEVMHKADVDDYFQCRADSWYEVRFVGIVNGARYVLETYDTTNTSFPPFRADVWQRFEDDGAAVASMTVKWKMNGLTLRTFTIASMTGYAAFAAAAAGAVLTEMNSSVLAGMAFRGGVAPPPTFYAFGARFVDISAESDTTQTSQEHDSTIVAYTRGYIDVGTTNGGKLSRAIGAGHYNPEVQTAVFRNEVYSVDGSRSLIFNPSTLSIRNWEADVSMGGFPARCRLIAEWRLRPVLARTDTDPTAYYIGRLGRWTDFSYNADPIPTAAFAGVNSPATGQPADPINALIPWSADYLVFGGTTTMNMMAGDPQIGGQLVNITRKTGIIGPRAWCIDGVGALWWIGHDGLYRYAIGGQAVQMSRNRMSSMVDGIDGTSIFVQLAYDPVQDLIHIFRTHTLKSSECLHVVYDVTGDRFVSEDAYDANGSATGMNPWAVCVAGSSDPRERRPMLGCYDGWIRRFDDSANEDQRDNETASIDASVDIFVPEGLGTAETEIRELHVAMASGSTSVTLKWFTAPSPEEVAALSAGEVASWTVAAGGGYTRPLSVRRRGGSHKLRVTADAAAANFAIERINCSIVPRSRRR